MAIVQDPAQLDRHKLIAERAHVPVERQPLQIDMRRAEDRRAGGFVAPAAFDANEPILDDVDPADAVLPSEGVEGKENVNGVGVGLVVLVGESNFDGEPGDELDGDALGDLGRVFGCGGELPHVNRGCSVGIFEDAGFVGDMEEVFVGGPGFCGCLGDGNGFFGGIGEEGLPAREAVIEF